MKQKLYSKKMWAIVWEPFKLESFRTKIRAKEVNDSYALKGRIIRVLIKEVK